LVEQVERADLQSSETTALLQQFIQPLLAQGADTLVLGCTHYPFLRDSIQRMVGEGVTLIDPAEAVARELVRRLAEATPGSGNRVDAAQPQGSVQFFTSGDAAQAQAVMAHLWDQPLTVQALP
jgi:glutamate racemase